jgi:hypothetical protein
VATLNVIRRLALRDQMSIREIARRTDLACNTTVADVEKPQVPDFFGAVGLG